MEKNAVYYSKKVDDPDIGVEIDYHENDGDRRFPPHWHEYLQLYFFKEGKAILQCGSNEIEATSGSLVVINSREIHSTRTMSKGMKYYIIRFDLSFLYSQEEDACQKHYIAPLRENLIFFENLIEGDEELESCVNRLIEEYTDKKTGYELYIKANLLRLLAILMRGHVRARLTQEETENISRKLWRFSPVIEYIGEKYQEELSLENLAGLLDVTESHFCRIFKKTFGKSAMDYINSVRLEHAMELLTDTSLSITEIADLSGFSDINYFSRTFKKHQKITPSEYRKNQGESYEAG